MCLQEFYAEDMKRRWKSMFAMGTDLDWDMASELPPRFFRAQYPGSAAPGGHMTARSVAPRSYPTPRGVLDMSSYQNDTPQQLHALNFSTRPAAERSA